MIPKFWGTTYHVQCEESMEFDQTMEPAKYNGYWKEHKIFGMTSEQTQQLDPFGKAEHPDKLSNHNVYPRIVIEALRTAPHGVRDQHIENKGQ